MSSIDLTDSHCDSVASSLSATYSYTRHTHTKTDLTDSHCDNVASSLVSQTHTDGPVLVGVAAGQLSTNDGPICNTPQQHNR